MVKKYKLTYFNARGRAEIVRLIFAQAGIAYEDVRLEGEQWQQLKSSTPFGGLPILEVDGEVLCQTNAIARYVAKQCGLAGKTDLEQAKVDMIVDCIVDSRSPMIKWFQEKDEAKKAEIKKKFEDEDLPASLEKLEKLLVANKGGSGYFVGDSMTFADLEAFQLMSMGDSGMVAIKADKFPKLKALKERVAAQPKIAQWIAKRPASNF